MIDKFFFWLFGTVDGYVQWIEKRLEPPKKKKRKAKSDAWIRKRIKKK